MVDTVLTFRQDMRRQRGGPMTIECAPAGPGSATRPGFAGEWQGRGEGVGGGECRAGGPPSPSCRHGTAPGLLWSARTGNNVCRPCGKRSSACPFPFFFVPCFSRTNYGKIRPRNQTFIGPNKTNKHWVRFLNQTNSIPYTYYAYDSHYSNYSSIPSLHLIPKP